MTVPVEIRRLNERDTFGTFSSTEPALDKFLKERAKRDQRNSVSATHLAFSGVQLVAYVTICSGAIELCEIPEPLRKKLPRYPRLPVLLLARMATDSSRMKTGIGSQLMRRVVFAEALELAERIGCVGVYVDAKPEAVTYYQRFGFVSLLVKDEAPHTKTTAMFLPIATIKAASDMR